MNVSSWIFLTIWFRSIHEYGETMGGKYFIKGERNV